MEILTKGVGAVLLFVVAILSLSFALSGLWALFVVPLGLPAIGMAHAYGLSLLISMFRLNPKKDGEHGLTYQGFVEKIILICIISFIALGFGHLAAIFM